MLVHNRKYPNISINQDGIDYNFKNGECEMPDGVALRLTQMGGDYFIDKSSLVSGFVGHFDPKTWTKDYKKIIWDGPIGYNNGYGKASMMMIEGLDKLLDLHVINSRWIGSIDDFLGDNLERILKKTTSEVDSYYLKFFPAFEFRERAAERFVGYTMLEASRIPQSWVDMINQNCERCIVPAIHQKQAFIDSGVVRDIQVVPLGIKTEMFPLLERETDGLYYFGTMGTLTYRKGTDILVRAFLEGLPKEQYPDARLYIKSLPVGGFGNIWFGNKQQIDNDGRIEMCFDSFSPDELIKDFFAKIDCFVFPTRGEGWGLPPMEAIATGLPTICTTYSGTGDFINEKTGLPIEYSMVDVPNGTAGGYPKELQAVGQQWAEPNFDQLVEHMRWCYNNREKAKKLGTNASKIIKKKYDHVVCAQQLVDYLDKKF